jgi:uncharacterized protein YdaU (DUF1376 family)
MCMWNAGGSLPDDDVKLSRICCLSVKKWRAIRDDIEVFFAVSEGTWTHDRLTKELRKSESKSQSRASAGAKGGRAKALKDKQSGLANASDLPWHSPDTRERDRDKSLSLTRAKKRGPTICPTDWTPGENTIQSLTSEGFSASQLDHARRQMVDWSRGGGKKKHDWDATFRNWVRNDRPRATSPPRKSRDPMGDAADEFLRQEEARRYGH